MPLVNARPSTIPRSLTAAIVGYSVVFICASAVQYWLQIYAGHDLGIFTNVLWNSSRGDLFTYSFNPYSYLVDHRAWLLMLLVPVFWIAPHPLSLLVIQTIGIALGAIPIYLLAQRILTAWPTHKRQLFALIAAGIYLLNPTVQAMNLFEFHVLPFLMPLSLWLWLCIVQQQWRRAAVISIAIVLLREDTGIVVAGVGLLTVIEYWQSRIARIFGSALTVCSSLWVIAMMWLGARLAPDGAPKFYFFFEYLGSTPQDILRFFFTRPLDVLHVIIGHDHLLAVAFLFLPFAFLPLIKPRYLLPAVVPLFIYLLINTYIFAALVKSHYSAMVIPWVLLAALHGANHLYTWLHKCSTNWKIPLLSIAGAVIGCSVLYFGMLAGPWIDFGSNVREQREHHNASATQNLLSTIPHDASVMASDGLYPHLATRQHIYSSLLTFTGGQHYDDGPYQPPAQLDYIILEHKYLLRYHVQFTTGENPDAWWRLQQLVSTNNLVLLAYTSEYIVYGPAHSASGTIIEPIEPVTMPLEHELNSTYGQIALNSWQQQQQFLQLDITVNESPQPEEVPFVQVEWITADGRTEHSSILPIGDPHHPLHAWEPGTRALVNIPAGISTDATVNAVTIGPITQQPGSISRLSFRAQFVDNTAARIELLDSTTPPQTRR